MCECGTDVSCAGVNVKDQIKITAEIELDKKVCGINTRVSFDLHIFGQSRSTLAVDIDPMCECENCPAEPNPAPCNQNGDRRATKVCGACQCVDNQGDTCQCSKEGGVELNKLIEQCQSGPGKSECSGHGTCHCGICKCAPGFFGKYCGCRKRNSNCGEAEGRGVPHCEQEKSEVSGKVSCKCNPGWKTLPGHGQPCECSTRTDWCEKVCIGVKVYSRRVWEQEMAHPHIGFLQVSRYHGDSQKGQETVWVLTFTSRQHCA